MDPSSKEIDHLRLKSTAAIRDTGKVDNYTATNGKSGEILFDWQLYRRNRGTRKRSDTLAEKFYISPFLTCKECNTVNAINTSSTILKVFDIIEHGTEDNIRNEEVYRLLYTLKVNTIFLVRSISVY